jgi:hypothetical protein
MQTKAAERMRRMRARRKAGGTVGNILFERSDWRLFTDPRTLPQKAGCEPDQIGRVILKELVDNALDTGAAEVRLDGDDASCVVSDNGPGLDRDTVLRVFAANRPLVSSKLQRLPTRGMLSNGLRVVMGAVAAYNGKISVTTRGERFDLVHNSVRGVTEMRSAKPAPVTPGLTVELLFPQPLFDPNDFDFARQAIRVAADGTCYRGPSLPAWYSPRGLHELLAAAPEDIAPCAVIEEVFRIADVAPDSPDWAETLIAASATLRGKDIGELGEAAFPGCYRRRCDMTTIDGAEIPFCVEAWALARAMEKGEDSYTQFHPLINRSNAVAKVDAYANSTGLRLSGCGVDVKLSGPKRAVYFVDLSVITPFLRLTGDGKAPYLADFNEAIGDAVKGAAGEAYRNLIRPRASMSVGDAAWEVMEEAYLKASDDGTLPAKARQIMYAARGRILELTGLKKFSDKYFTQSLLPDYLQGNADETADWDVVYDARGHLVEPHTDKQVALGTIAVRQYVGQRPRRHNRPALASGLLYPTAGPRDRYRNILFVEKEGFDELFEAVQLAERYDLAIMSTKGMSVVAARSLLDEVAPSLDHIFVLHDFDISGFSIFGTLGTDSRRYTFTNDVEEKIIDIGLRLPDVEPMSLEPETVEVKSREARRMTLHEHGASIAEIKFLAPYNEGEPCRRVELNAMTSRQLVDFVEAALEAHGVAKVMPAAEVLHQHARHRLETKLTGELIAAHAEVIARRAAATELPDNLATQVAELLQLEPALSWDQALARLI